MKPDGMLKSDHKEKQSSKADRLETPDDNYYNIVHHVSKYGIDPPTLDVFASLDNSKCINCITKEQNSMFTEFLLPDGKIPKTIWCNAPHSDYKSFLNRVHCQYLKYDFNCIILIPTTNSRTTYWHEIVEPNRIDINPNGYCFYYPLKGTIYFTLDHKPLLDKDGKPSHAHNAYFVLLFIKKNKVKEFKLRLQREYANEF